MTNWRAILKSAAVRTGLIHRICTQLAEGASRLLNIHSGNNLSKSFPSTKAILAFVGVATTHFLLAADKPASNPSNKPPVVVSTEKFQSTQSEFLKRPGSTSSQRATTASPHRTRFFGVEAAGERFVFVIDNSTSMLDGGRLGRVHAEVNRAIAQLKWPQSFYLIAFDSQTQPIPWGPFVAAQSKEAQKVRGWLARLSPHDGTLPGPALRQAVGLKPDAVFFLTDGEFDDPAPALVKTWNKFQVPVHVLDFGPGPPSANLQKIAAESGGVYRKMSQ